MRTISQLVSGLGLACVALLLVAADASAQEAKILKILGSGTATVVVNGQSQAAHEQMAVPLNAQINTTGQEVYLEVVPGVVAAVKPNSRVIVEDLGTSEPKLELKQGSVVSQIDKTRLGGKQYGVKTPRGVAAARGTAFSVNVDGDELSITTTADTVSFTNTTTGASFTVQAGMISITPAGATTPNPPIPLATAVATNPEVAAIVRDAVQTVTTVVQNNLGNISSSTATNLVSQIVSVAVTAIPTEAAAFTSEAVAAVTASGSATAGDAATAAGAVTAAAVKSAPEDAAQIAGAAAAAAPEHAGVVTAAAQIAAPEAKDAIAQQVAASTGQSTSTVQTNADAAKSDATKAVNAADDATSHVVTPAKASAPKSDTNQNPPKTTEHEDNTPKVPVVQPDGSNAGG